MSHAPWMVFIALVGCNGDQKFTERVDTDLSDDVPQIVVDPDELQYGLLDLGTSETRSFTIRNEGGLDLHVSSISVQGSSAFTLLVPGLAPTLPPGEEVTVDVQFSPLGPEDAAEVHIINDDLGNPEPIVSVYGTGKLPELLVTPDPYDFGRVRIGCSRSTTLRFQNIGDADLTLSTVAQVGEGFELELPFALPHVLAPGASVEGEIRIAPTAEASYTSTVYVASDAAVNTTTAEQRGAGMVDGTVVEEFYQGDGPWEKADILFYVDQSGSMRNNKRILSNNFENFASRLDSLDLEWQVGVVTRDTGCFNHGILTRDTPSLVEAFTDAVDELGGDYTEAGLTLAERALTESYGGCNDGFLRSDAKTTLILVSDEPEQSPSPWDHYVNQIRELAPSATITAIVGDVPDGCATAEPGSGYYEASVATGGAFMSICAADWSPYFDTIATMTASGTTDTFVLTSLPDPATITVTVDDVPSTDWTYDATLNAILFAEGAVPEPGAHIQVSFELTGDCEA